MPKMAACVRPCVRPLARPDATAATAAMPVPHVHVAHVSSRTVCRVEAGRSAVARRRRAAAASPQRAAVARRRACGRPVVALHASRRPPTASPLRPASRASSPPPSPPPTTSLPPTTADSYRCAAHAKSGACTCVRPRARPLRGRYAAAAAAALPGPRAHIAHDPPCPVCRVGADHSAVTVPPQRRHSAPTCPAAAAPSGP